MLKIGSVIDGKYKILNIVGKGGMSIVYLAMNEKANKQWAIKEILKRDYRNFDMDKKEIEMMKRLKHPNLPAIVDVIEQEDALLIVMDYIEGRSLEDLLQEYGPQDEKAVIDWAKQLCDVLQYLHTRTPPIIYRDMKPSNIMLRPDGHLMLIDFGAAREYKEGNLKDTVLLGTRGYAAPEQYRLHGQSDARTDIYSLGATMFHMLRPEISAGLEHIVMKCLRVEKDERYQTAAELLDDLTHYWEYDKKYQKEQKRKGILFFIPLLLSLFFAINSAIFTFLKINTRENNYAAYLLAARNSTTKEEEVENYQKAILIAPENEEAYQKLLKNAFLDDGLFSVEESETLRHIFIDYGEKMETNERSFRKNRSGYARFCYELGIAYFYKFEDKNNKKYAAGYLETAADSEFLEEPQKMRANRLYVISDYYARIGLMDEAGDIFITYKDYWSDLCAATQGNLVEEDNERTALVMYEEIVSQIISRSAEFRNAGVTKEEILLQIENIELHLKNDFLESEEPVVQMLKEEMETLWKNLRRAKRITESVYKQAE